MHTAVRHGGLGCARPLSPASLFVWEHGTQQVFGLLLIEKFFLYLNVKPPVSGITLGDILEEMNKK